MEISLVDFREAVSTLESAADRSGLLGQDRYELLRTFDPYADTIAPSLLNAGHLATYAYTVGMIDPFDVGKLTKPATYLVGAEGPVRYKDETGKVERFYLTTDLTKRYREAPAKDCVRLAPNSICFLTLEPMFRMPAYIGARFNLVIASVYRGLLVGTGPLVDPGFCGRLSIPIHNFTNREYIINAGEGLVYFEFTKITWRNALPAASAPPWLPPAFNDQPPFPSSKNNRRTLDDYLALATGGGPPQSAIGVEIAKIGSQAAETRLLLRVLSISGFVAALVLVLTAWQVYLGALQFSASAQTELRESRSGLEKEILQLKSQVDGFQRLIDKPASK
jgi:deoxycytidine triphosphate deaminase